MRDWSELAATAGFSDQAHLVRDCRAFAGLTPTAWAAAQAARAGFLQDGTITALYLPFLLTGAPLQGGAQAMAAVVERGWLDERRAEFE